MAEFPTKRIINLGEQSAPQSGDYIVTDNQTNGTKKTPASALATSQALAAEVTARQQADEAEAQARAEAITAEQTAREEADDALTESVTALSDEVTAQGELIQNPTKTVSGSIAHFTDGADMPAQSVIVNIEPQQSGTGTPSPDNVRPISGWESVSVTVSPTQDAQDGTTTTTSLGRAVYGGTLDVVSGVLTVKWGQILGTAWTQYNTSNGYKAYRIDNVPQAKVGGIGKSNMISEYGSFNSSAMTKNIIQLPDYTGIVYMALDEAVSASDVQLVYELLQPQTYQLTPTEVKTLLGENNVWADAGAVSITYRRDINLALEQLEALLNS